MIELEMLNTPFTVELRLSRLESKVTSRLKELLLELAFKQLKEVSLRTFYSQDLIASPSTETLFFTSAFSWASLLLAGLYQFKN